MARTLYDLAAADDKRRFSPYCWRVKMALAHKELEVETVPWRFTEKDVIAFSGQGRVPVLIDGDKVVADSWAIANDLEDRYPDRKSLFGDVTAGARVKAVPRWYRPDLRRLCRLRRLSVGACDESVQAPRTERSRCRLARTDARSLWRLGAELCRLSCLSDR